MHLCLSCIVLLWMPMYCFVWISVFNSLPYMCRCGSLVLLFNNSSNYQIFLNCLHYFTSPLPGYAFCKFSNAEEILLFLSFLKFISIVGAIIWHLIRAVAHISLLSKYVEHIFMLLWPFVNLFLEKNSFPVLCLVLLSLFLDYNNSFYNRITCLLL